MVAGASSCTCAECGVVCTGRFNGCPAVWARGPVAVAAPHVMEQDVYVGASWEGRVAEDHTAVDFSLAPVLPLPEADRPASPPPGPRRQAAVAAPAPRRQPPPRVPPPLPAPATDGDRLAILRARIEGLRGEVKAFGDKVGQRTPREPSSAADSA